VIWFIIFFILAFFFAIYLMRKMKKEAKEITIFSTIAWLGFILWIFVFLEHPVSPNKWIAWVINGLGI